MSEAAHTAERVVPEFDIGDRMRKAREHAVLSQAQIAGEIGVGRTSIIGYETGRQKPSKPVVRAWAFRTGVPYEWICHADTDPCGPPGSRLPRSEGHGGRLDSSANTMQSSQTKLSAA